MGTRVRRTAVSIGMVLVLLAVTAGAAVAAPKDTWKFSWSGYTADAFVGECVEVEDVVSCEGIGVYLFSGKSRNQGSGAIRGTEVCVSIFSDSYNHVTDEFSYDNEYGCTTDLGAGTSIARDLSSATIGLTTLTLQQESCNSETGCTLGGERDVDVEGVFTAIGPATKQSHRSTYDDGICTVKDSFKGTARQSEFLGTVDGQSFEVVADDFNGYSQIGDGSSSYSGRCSLE